jgi:hypothetical protein
MVSRDLNFSTEVIGPTAASGSIVATGSMLDMERLVLLMKALDGAKAETPLIAERARRLA